MQATMETLLACLNHFPLFAIMLRLKDPDRLPGGLRLEVCPERFFFDRATPLRWVVSSLRSVTTDYPQQQQQQPRDGYSSGLNLDQQQTFQTKQDIQLHPQQQAQLQQQENFTSRRNFRPRVLTNPMEAQTVSDKQGAPEGIAPNSNRASPLPNDLPYLKELQDTIPRTVSYLFLTVSTMFVCFIIL